MPGVSTEANASADSITPTPLPTDAPTATQTPAATATPTETALLAAATGIAVAKRMSHSPRSPKISGSRWPSHSGAIPARNASSFWVRPDVRSARSNPTTNPAGAGDHPFEEAEEILRRFRFRLRELRAISAARIFGLEC